MRFKDKVIFYMNYYKEIANKFHLKLKTKTLIKN